jgi:hypothetical protein
LQNSELTVLSIAIEVEMPDSLQHVMHILLPFLHVCQEDEYTVKATYHEIFNI